MDLAGAVAESLNTKCTFRGYDDSLWPGILWSGSVQEASYPGVLKIDPSDTNLRVLK